MATEDMTISWEAPSHRFVDRPKDWYLSIVIIGIALIGIAIVFQNFLFALLIVFSVIALFLEASRRPAKMRFAITRRGIRSGTVLYPYENLESFWMRDDEHGHEISFRSNRSLTPIIILPLAKELDPEDMRDLLLDVLPEVPHEKSLLERIGDFLGF